MSEPVRGSGRNITGAEYVSVITSRESDRRARAAFRARALELVPAGGMIFDFGAGPGLDARFYAEHDRRVGAYDVDPQMCRYFADYCGEQIGKGLISLHQGSYAQFLASAHGAARADLITANFAPLNLIDDLKALFAAFAALTQADGRVLASVLSPYFVGDLRYRWWWRNLTQLRRTGRFSVPGAGAHLAAPARGLRRRERPALHTRARLRGHYAMAQRRYGIGGRRGRTRRLGAPHPLPLHVPAVPQVTRTRLSRGQRLAGIGPRTPPQ